MKKLLLGLLVVLNAISLFSDTVAIDGIVWEYQVIDGKAEIYGGVWTSAIPETTTGSITIPSTLGSYPVTTIGYDAFYGCSGLTSITIPDSVTYIGCSAFEGCNESIYDLETIPGVKLVDGWVVDYTEECPTELNLTGVRGVAGGAFEYCRGLTSVTIPDSVTCIGDGAFFDCSGLRSITIPDSVTYIGYDAFYGCSGLTSITIPDSVTYIGYDAFYGCSGLTSITIPDSVTSIDDYAFSGCSGLKSFSVSPNNPSYKSVNGLLLSKDGKTLIAGINCDVIIPDSVTYIGDCAFYCCSSLTSITIPDSVTYVGSSAFEWCNESIYDLETIPGVKLVDGWVVDYSEECPTELNLTGVRGVAGGAFEYCRGLTSVTIPDSVTCIGDGAFFDCSGLRSITIPDSVTYIGYDAFYGCSGLTSITIPDSVTSIDNWAFFGCNGLAEAIFLGDAPRDVGDDIFDYCADDFVIKVRKGTKGWNGDPNSTELSETWYGYPIEYDSADNLYPVLDANATAEDVANALSGSVDENLAKNITSVEMYNNYREWASSVNAPTGEGMVGVEAVKASTTAWMSFALDLPRLIANEPVEGDVSIASLDAVAADGSFEFTVNIDKIDVGDGSVEENLKKLFRIEGATSLGNDANFSSENVEIELAEPVEGDVKFKILPKDSPDSFFIRAKLLK